MKLIVINYSRKETAIPYEYDSKEELIAELTKRVKAISVIKKNIKPLKKELNRAVLIGATHIVSNMTTQIAKLEEDITTLQDMWLGIDFPITSHMGFWIDHSGKVPYVYTVDQWFDMTHAGDLP